MGKVVGAIIAVGAVVVTAGLAAPLISGAIVGIGGMTFAAVGVAQVLAPALALGLGVFAGQVLGGILGLGPNIPKPDTAETALRTPRPPRVSAYGTCRLYGAYILFESSASGFIQDGVVTRPSGGTAVDVHAVHDGELTEVVQRYLADDKITLTGDVVNEGTDGRYADGKLRFYNTTGASPGTPFQAVIDALPGVWTENHRGDGVVLLALLSKPVKAKNFLDVYPNGVPVPSIAAKWQKCPDFHAADPCDESEWTWTENVVRQLGHYKLVREGVDYATKIAPTLEFWRAAQDVCDEEIPLKAGGTEPRYRSCLAHKHTDQHGAVTASLLTACDGWIAPRADGALVIYAGKYYEPTISIGPEHIVSYEWSGVGVDDDEAMNEIICSYVSADHDYNTVECDAWRNEDDILARGQVLSQGFEPQVPSHGQVRRLAKRKMARNNAVYRGTVTTNIAGRIVRGERYINLLLADAGATFYDGPVEITAVTRNIGTGGVTFSWVSVSPNVDAWNAATEEGEPAPVGERVAAAPIDDPVIDTAIPILTGDGLSAQIAVSVDAEDRDDITWYGRWKLTSDTIWNEQEYSDIDASTSIELLIGLVPVDASVDVAVSYKLGDGRTSNWSDTETVSTSTAGLAPGSPTELSATGGVGEADVTWRNPSSTNLSYVKVFRNTANIFGTATDITGEVVGGLGEVMAITDTGLSAGTKYYWVVAYNAADVASPPAGPATATVT